MSQVNSGISTKACTYDFNIDGALGNGVFAFSGITIKPGEAVADIRVTKGLNLVSGAGDGTLFQFGWGPNPTPGFGFQPFFSDTIGNINTYLFYLYQSPTLNIKWSNSTLPRIPATINGSSSLWFTSNNALTAGSVHFVVTYIYTKF